MTLNAPHAVPLLGAQHGYLFAVSKSTQPNRRSFCLFGEPGVNLVVLAGWQPIVVV